MLLSPRLRVLYIFGTVSGGLGLKGIHGTSEIPTFSYFVGLICPNRIAELGVCMVVRRAALGLRYEATANEVSVARSPCSEFSLEDRCSQ